MTIPLTLDQRIAIAQSLRDLEDDLHNPVYVEGDVYLGPMKEEDSPVLDMASDAAGLAVVDKVLEHPDMALIWETLVWIAENVDYLPPIPDRLRPVMETAWGVGG